MDKIQQILIHLQNGETVDRPYDQIRSILQHECMHLAYTPSTVTTYGERGHEYIQEVRLVGPHEKMKVTPKGGTQTISFFNEDWTTNLTMQGWDHTPGVWFQSQIKHLKNLN
jgi:hypothetical protein